MERPTLVTSLFILLVGPVGCGAASEPVASAPIQAQPSAASADTYRAILGVDRLKALKADAQVIVVDVRSAEDYAKGHIPGAINLPGDLWRTPAQKGGKPSHDFFTKADGSIDGAKYEALLGGAGIASHSKVIVYGNHSGKADGSVPVMVLIALGHKEVGFLDGVGLDRWKAAGNPVVAEASKLPPTAYRAQTVPNFLWSAADVSKNLKAADVVFVDARSPAEFSGTDARDNKRAGHIPGAVNMSFEELLTKDKTTLAPAEARKLLAARGITPSKRVVVYCQTATRAAHNVMVMRELGHANVAVYDGSWQEWGNRDDTPVEK